MTKENKTNRWD